MNMNDIFSIYCDVKNANLCYNLIKEKLKIDCVSKHNKICIDEIIKKNYYLNNNHIKYISFTFDDFNITSIGTYGVHNEAIYKIYFKDYFKQYIRELREKKLKKIIK